MGFLIIAAIAAFLGAAGIFYMRQINTADEKLYKENTMGIDYASTAGTFFQRIRYILLETTILEDDKLRKENADKVVSFAATIDEKLAAYKARIAVGDKDDQALYDKLDTDWVAYKGYIDQITVAIDSGNIALAEQIILKDSDATLMAVKDDLEQLLAYNENAAGEAYQFNQNVYASASLLTNILILAGVMLSIILGLIISRSISKPINQIVNAADKLAEGDVEINLDLNRKDEIGVLATSFGKMADNIRNQSKTAERIADGDLTVDVNVRSDNDLLGKKLYEMVHNNNDMISNIATTSEQVAVGARQVSDASMALSQGATEQASAIEELTASLEQISSQTHLNAKNANQANQLAVTAKESAVKGNEQMKEMLKAMVDINESSANISKVIKVIDDIAFQTNILALNAAVEAARAGQHGKGFAVVAEEVRNLAARSANAAKETTDMIEGSIKKAEGGTRIARETADALNSIVVGVEKVAGLVGDIATASNEQALGISQINQGIAQVSQVVQTNSATSEESASASEQLSSQASALKETIGRFKLKKSAGSHTYYDGVSPEVLMMLENMNKSKHKDTVREVPDETSNKLKIALSDNEFGKY
jgi:methyl-accepting chemotaxis protein